MKGLIVVLTSGLTISAVQAGCGGLKAELSQAFEAI